MDEFSLEEIHYSVILKSVEIEEYLKKLIKLKLLNDIDLKKFYDGTFGVLIKNYQALYIDMINESEYNKLKERLIFCLKIRNQMAHKFMKDRFGNLVTKISSRNKDKVTICDLEKFMLYSDFILFKLNKQLQKFDPDYIEFVFNELLIHNLQFYFYWDSDCLRSLYVSVETEFISIEIPFQISIYYKEFPKTDDYYEIEEIFKSEFMKEYNINGFDAEFVKIIDLNKLDHEKELKLIKIKYNYDFL